MFMAVLVRVLRAGVLMLVAMAMAHVECRGCAACEWSCESPCCELVPVAECDVLRLA